MKDYTLNLITAPLVEPISLTEASLFLRIDEGFTEDDDYIQGLITTARQFCEDFQNRAYITQTWEMSLNDFSYSISDKACDYYEKSLIEIPKGSLQKVNTFTYKDANGIVNDLTEDIDFVLSTRGILGRICPPFGCVFPCEVLYPLDPIIINFTCGYGDVADSVPLKIKQAIYLMVSHWYDNRSVISDRGGVPSEISFTVKSLLQQDRITIY
ncbi:MAG: head-tail connector protein [Clostridia bacterium]|jgi:uncharacterized phiE125 gp8 family phage protein